MFDFVRKHTRLLQFVLVLLIFPSFVFFGIQGYSSFNEGRQSVAKVAGQEVTQAEWDAAHRSQVERARAQMPGIDAKLFDTPEMRQRTLEGLVQERVILTAANKLNLATTDERLQRLFASTPEFAALRNPDGSLKKEFLAAQGMTSEQFAERLRQNLSTRQVLLGIEGSAMGPATAADLALESLFQQREIQVARFDAKNYAAKVNPTDAELEAYYNDAANAAQFQAPEQASVEYVQLDLDAIKSGITVSEADARKFYADNEKRYSTPEERRASHILIKADKSAPAAEREKAKARAQELLAEARKNPAGFADLAKKNSQDPGSAARGGELDFFGRGAMVKPFEDAAFALKPGELSAVVESDFGFHIIKLTAVRGGEKRPFEAVKAEIENELKQQKAQQQYTEAAEVFTNTVYEQADSLKPVADKLKLQVRTLQNVTRTPGPDTKGPFANPKLLEALFGTDSLRNKRNTEAVEVGPNQLVSARILQHSPARKLPLEEVKAKVRDSLVAKQAGALARKDGEAQLEAWKKDAAAAALQPAVVVSRSKPAGDVPRAVVEAALKAPADPVPAWTGVDLGDQGYAVIRINKVLPRDPAVADAARSQAQYAQAWAAAEAQAYYAALKDRYKVQITGDAKTAGSAEDVASGASR
jgi:peptidyl-prolyl cis-trans isomerase D